jgi:uncharacterized UBP type Zn finger protein
MYLLTISPRLQLPQHSTHTTIDAIHFTHLHLANNISNKHTCLLADIIYQTNGNRVKKKNDIYTRVTRIKTSPQQLIKQAIRLNLQQNYKAEKGWVIDVN